MKRFLSLFICLLVVGPISSTLSAQISKYTMDEFMGVNILREDPVEYFDCVGGVVREFHDWGVDQGNVLDYY